MTTAVMAEYGALLGEKLPHVIKTAEDYETSLADAKRLMESEALSAAEVEYLDVLTVLIEKYEDEHFELPHSATPVEVLNELFAARDMTVTELGNLINSKGNASEMLSGKRPISKEAAKRFAEYFHVSPALFI
jgi:HTH-type transcriptional regulator / antitoxin HigA